MSEEKKISAKDLAAHICKQMPGEQALGILLANQMTHYEKLKLEKQPEDNPESVSPYFIIVAASLDMGWGVMVEKSHEIVRGLSIGTKEYLEDLVTYKISGEDLGALLFGIHTHAGMLSVWEGEQEDHVAHPDEIVYREKDLLTVLKAIGLPDPVWGKSLTVEEYLKSKTKKDEVV